MSGAAEPTGPGAPGPSKAGAGGVAMAPPLIPPATVGNADASLLDVGSLPWRQMLDHAPDPMLLTDVEARILFANRQLCIRLGHQLTELVGRPVDVVLPEARRHLCSPLQEAGAVHTVTLARAAGGETRPVAVGVSVVPHGRHQLLLASLRLLEPQAATPPDVASDSLRSILDTMSAFVGLFTPDGQALLLNRAVLDVSSLSEGALKAVRLPDLAAWSHDPQERRKIIEAMALAAAGQAVRIAVTALIGGSVRHLDLMFAPLRGRDQRIDMIVGTAVDVTDRAASEQYRQLAGRMEALGKLASGIAFDFNNLLSIISDSIETLQDHLGDTQRARPLTETALRAAYQGASLTRSLLSFAREEAMTPAPADAARLVESAADLLRRILPASIELRLACAPGCELGRTDPGQLQNAVVSLVVNARDAMPTGGTLTIRTDRVRVEEARAARLGVAPGDYVCVRVNDTGRGMAPDVAQRAIEPFFTTRENASGLGLSMVHAFARMSGGQVELESAPGAGTSVSLLLPARVTPAALHRFPA